MYNKFLRMSAIFGIYVSLASPAYAYLDAATGSIIIQAVIGAVGTWIVYSKLFLARTKGFLKGIFAKNSDQTSDG